MSEDVSSEETKDESEEQPVIVPEVSVLRRQSRSFEAVSPIGGGGGTPLWLITFTDIMALMLTFFVLLYTMSVPKEEHWDELTSGMTQGFSVSKSAKFSGADQDTISIDKLDLSDALSLNYLEALLRGIVSKNDNLKDVVIIPQAKQLILSLPSDLLFEVGKANMSTQGKRALFALGGPLSRIRNRVEVVGHADPRPIENKAGAFSSNWELSLARAASVAGALENAGYARDVVLKGLSSGRYDDLSIDTPEDERLNLSRRVDVVIMRDDGSQRF